VETSTDHVLEVARELERRGLVKMEGELAGATSALLAQAATFESDARSALEELEKKHAFERG
jgi:hypothetical protein